MAESKAENFVASLDAEALEFFNNVAAKPFSQQAVAFLNAYWEEVGSQAEFIFTVSWELMKYADMHAKGVSLIHLYEEGLELDFNIGLYFYEKLCKYVEDNAQWAEEQWAISQPQMLTAIVRKKELRDKVDVNFDGKVSFLEYLLYQYREFANPADFVTRSIAAPDEHPEIRKARLALEAVNAAIKAYESEKARLEKASEMGGVKGLTAKHTLAQLESGPLMEQLNKALITAEAAVRMATRKFGKGAALMHGVRTASGAESEAPTSTPTEGSLWWMNRDLEEKKKRYASTNTTVEIHSTQIPF